MVPTWAMPVGLGAILVRTVIAAVVLHHLLDLPLTVYSLLRSRYSVLIICQDSILDASAGQAAVLEFMFWYGTAVTQVFPELP